MEKNFESETREMLKKLIEEQKKMQSDIDQILANQKTLAYLIKSVNR